MTESANTENTRKSPRQRRLLGVFGRRSSLSTGKKFPFASTGEESSQPRLPAVTGDEDTDESNYHPGALAIIALAKQTAALLAEEKQPRVRVTYAYQRRQESPLLHTVAIPRIRPETLDGLSKLTHKVNQRLVNTHIRTKIERHGNVFRLIITGPAYRSAEMMQLMEKFRALYTKNIPDSVKTIRHVAGRSVPQLPPAAGRFSLNSGRFNPSR